MENSLRYDCDSKSLRIHAKEKILLASRTLLQMIIKYSAEWNEKLHLVSSQTHGELDTAFGAPSYLALILRHFYPESPSASVGVGVHLSKDEKLGYSVRGKKAFPLTSRGLVCLNLKGRCYFDKEFKERKAIGVVELAWSILNFQKDQDVRFKIGYDFFDKVPYFQFKENNWTLNAGSNGKWNVRFDL